MQNYRAAVVAKHSVIYVMINKHAKYARIHSFMMIKQALVCLNANMVVHNKNFSRFAQNVKQRTVIFVSLKGHNVNSALKDGNWLKINQAVRNKNVYIMIICIMIKPLINALQIAPNMLMIKIGLVLIQENLAR
ncbi:transmembrane protein, putative (macronuclear) [Tetrahymena thermophila SB210]|uniref:Transmembrane protein, putative n=1 Tax=Tetrahymena thermophila (strain SB210) TaxID=312017 RepID=W7X0D8_TETTS|nr:transmembrane protein, putative [Tetrahymena thermophila SB210]EWS72580.1 transmembrane protein, putative [Tetrahymena thermophila SB210]|eukprot:XP_012654863.1 transmembrane protein, putative [Tetrahymena thermophila SB210]